jgi:hypothetical protein
VQSKEIEVRTIWKLVRGGRVRLMGFKKWILVNLGSVLCVCVHVRMCTYVCSF